MDSSSFTAPGDGGQGWHLVGRLGRLAVVLAIGVLTVLAANMASADPVSPFVITKTDSADPVQSGDVLTYTVTIVNAASAKVDNVIMTDQVNHLGSMTDPPALPQLTLTSTKGNCTQSYFQTHYLVSCSAGTLKGGEAWTVTITGKVTAPSGTTINNTASVTGTKSAQNFTSTATATTQVANNPPSPLAELTVNKAGPSNVVAGSPLLYSLTVNNTGAANATDIRVVDTLPAGVALTSASGNSLFVCTPAGPAPAPVTVVCDGGRVNAGSNATIVINAVAPAALGPITNTAVVDPNQTIPENNDLNNTSAAITTTVTSAPAPQALTITKTDAPDPVVPGGTLTYSIHVENTGTGANSRADDVVVVDGTQGLEAASITASMVITNGSVGVTGGCTVAAPQVTCKIKSLNAGGTMDVTITGQVIADAGTTIINTATVTGNIKNTGVSATASAITEVKPAVDLSITKADAPDPVCARSWPLSPFGGPPYPAIPPLLAPPVCLGGLTYTLVVGNSGISTASNVVVRDELAEGLVFDSYQDTSGAGFACALDPSDPKPNVVKCDGGTLGPAAIATIKILVVAPPDTGAINNKAEVDPYNAIFEADETNNVVFEGTDVSTGIDLVIRKHDEPEDPPGAPNVTDGFDPIATSGTQTYTIFVDNVGTQDVTNIRVHDYLPANTTFLSAEGDHGFVCSYVAVSPLASHYVECEQGHLLGTAAEFYPPFGLPGDDFATIKIKIFATPVVMGPTGPMHNEVKVDPLHEINEVNELNNSDTEDTIVTVGGASLSAFNQLKITKTQTDPSPAAGDASFTVATNGTLIYNIHVENDGTDPVSAIVVQDTLPSGARFIEAKDTDAGPDVSDAFTCVHDGSATGGVVTCTDGALSGTVNTIPGVPTSRDITVKMFAPNTPGTYINLAKVDPGNLVPEGNEFDNESQVTTLVATVGAGGQNAFHELDITKAQTTPAGDVSTSSPVTYTITVTNSGSDPAFNVAVRDTLPAGFIYIEAKDGAVPPADPNAFLCSVAANVIDCTGATIDGTSNVIPAPSTRTITVKAFTATQPGFYFNQAIVDPNNTIPEGDETDNAAGAVTKVVVGAGYIDLQVTKSDTPDPVAPGGLLAYTLTVTNAGTDPAFNVNVRDVLPAGVTFVSADDTTPPPADPTADFICSHAAGVVNCTGGTLDGSLNLIDFDGGAPDTHPQSRTIVIIVQAPSDIQSLIVPPASLSDIFINITNQAFIDPTNAIPESNETNNSASETTKVQSKINLTLDKTGPSQAVQSTKDKYVLTVKNEGTAPALGVEIHDPLPVGLIILNVEADTSNFACQVLQNPVNVVDCVGDLGAGQTVKVTIEVFMTLETGTFDNEACVDPDDVIEETNETDNCDTKTTSVIAAGAESEVTNPGTCSDGLDNDADGDIDAADTDCQEDENANPGSCSDGFDNDADGDIDGADSGCPGAPDLSINKSADFSSVTLGQTLTYTLNVQNVGTGPAPSPVTIKDDLPDSVTFVNGVGTNGFTCSEASGIVTCTDAGSGLAAGGSTQITIQVTVGELVEDGGPPAITVGPNMNTSVAAGNQAEATIAIHPTDPQRIFVASNPGTTAALTTNGGTNWTQFTIGTLAGGTAPCCDNVAAWDDFGNLFLVRLARGADGNTGGGDDTVELLTSTTGGAAGSFSILQIIDTGSVDQPSVAVGAGSVWVTWNDGGTIRARGAAVTGLGTVGAFNAEQAATGSAAVNGQFGDIAIGPSGQVMVTYQSTTTCADTSGDGFSDDPGECEGPGSIFVNTDADGLGAGGFGGQVTATATNVGKFDFIPAQSGRSTDAEANLAYDRSGGPNNGRAYLVYTDETPDESDDTDIFVRTSNDNGANWSSAVQVNDDATTNSQFLPRLAIDQSTGFIGVTWHDARNDSGAGAGSTNATANDDAQFWGTFSSNGGASYLPNVQISAGTSNAAAAGSGVDYGDYTWVDFRNGAMYPVWADNSNSTGDNPPAGGFSRFDIYTARVTLGGSCTDGIDNGGADGLIDGADPDCAGPITNTATVDVGSEDGAGAGSCADTTDNGPDGSTDAADSDCPDKNTGNNSASVNTSIGAADVELVLVDLSDNPDPVTPGGILTYTMMVSNTGTATAAGVDVRTALPPSSSVEFINAAGSNGFVCVFSDPNVDCTGNLGAGELTTITIHVKVLETADAVLSATTTVDPPGGVDFAEADETNNQETEPTTVDAADCTGCVDLVMSQIIVTPDPVAEGADLTYIIAVGNAGDTNSGVFQIKLEFDADVDIELILASATEDGAGAGSCTDTIDNGPDGLSDAADPDCLTFSATAGFTCVRTDSRTVTCSGDLDGGEGTLINLSVHVKDPAPSASITLNAEADPASLPPTIAEFSEGNNTAGASTAIIP